MGLTAEQAALLYGTPYVTNLEAAQQIRHSHSAIKGIEFTSGYELLIHFNKPILIECKYCNSLGIPFSFGVKKQSDVDDCIETIRKIIETGKY